MGTAWRRVLASMVAVTLFAIALASRSPQVHEHIHCDAAQADQHACAITLASTGYCDTTAPAPEAGLRASALRPVLVEPGSFAWSTPAYWLIPAQAPPVREA